MNRKIYLFICIGAAITVAIYFVYKEIQFREIHDTTALHGTKSLPKGDSSKNLGKTDQTPDKNSRTSPTKIKKYSSNEYIASRDINSYINDLQSNSDDKGDILLAKAKGTSECAGVSVRPNYAEEQFQARTSMKKMTTEKIALIRKYTDVLAQRCAAFAQTEHMSRATIDNYYAQAAKEGSIQAEAYEVNKEISNKFINPTPDSLSVEEIRKKV